MLPQRQVNDPGHSAKSGIVNWPVAFTKVRLLNTDFTLAKCSEEQMNHQIAVRHISRIVTVYE